jgi:5,10-methylenetetrahydromethanopterin reductase
MIRMIHPHGFAPARPIDVPWVIAANGPKGIEIARQLGQGIMTVTGGVPGFEWCSTLVLGTVLDDGEALDAPRVIAAAGPALTVVYHAMYEGDPASVDGLPGGPEWRATLDAIPEPIRHLSVHEDHLVRVSDRDRALIEPSLLPAFTWTGTADAVRARAEAAAASGVTEVMYAPMGDDIERELRTFRAAVLG